MVFINGPRGRFFCYELAAIASNDDGRSPVYALMFDLAWMFSQHQDGTFRITLGEEKVPSSKATIAKLAAALDDVDLSGIRSHHLLEAFQASVDEARYWQDPTGTDMVLASSLLREPLSRIATHVASMDEAAWWFGPASGEQWESAYIPEELPRDEPGSVWEHVDDGWETSPGWGRVSSSRLLDRVPVHALLKEDRLGEDEEGRQILNPPTVTEVDEGLWRDLCMRFPNPAKRYRSECLDGHGGPGKPWVSPNWAEVGREYEALHLSLAAYLQLSGAVMDLGEYRTVITGWDPDVTYYFREVEKGPRRIWRHLHLR